MAASAAGPLSLWPHEVQDLRNVYALRAQGSRNKSVARGAEVTLKEALFIFWVLVRAVWWQVLRKVTGRSPEWMP